MKPLALIILWHMHQPDYRDPETGHFVLPWVYLHALKDYSDMAAHLEAYPRMHAVVNFVPILVEQLEDYGQQFETGSFRDPLLSLLGHADFAALQEADRHFILERCFHANVATMIAPFAPYQRLYEQYTGAKAKGADPAAGFSAAMLADLITWYHLAWMGETERRVRGLFAELAAKGQGFTVGERLRLRKFIGDVLQSIIPRYRALAARGQIELSATPYSHPLAPLLIDFSSTREAAPDAELPHVPGYPGGTERVRAHIARARADHDQWFGGAPQGIWPAEGAVSRDFLALLGETHTGWAATSAAVLANSLRRYPVADAPPPGEQVYFSYRLHDAPAPVLFFRDEELSDLIGFEYKTWWASDAAKHFVGRLEKIRARIPDGETRVVSVILDGENAWEHYPYNGFYFFKELYGRLEAHADIQPTTFSAHLAAHPLATRRLEGLAAGSWVHGNFLKWIGSPDKNRAWELLCGAKQAYDQAFPSGAPPATERLLRACESSDWFWWFGDYDPHGTVASFDSLFRKNLRALYRALGVAPPAVLDEPVSHGGGAPESHGTMGRAQ